MSAVEKSQNLKPSQAALKKPYQTPTVRWERVFETLALSCGKTTGSTQAQCHNNRKAS